MERNGKDFNWMCIAATLISASFFVFNVSPNYKILGGMIIFSFVARVFILLRKMEENKRWYWLDHFFDFIFTISFIYVLTLILKKCSDVFDEKILGIAPIVTNNAMAGVIVFATVVRFFQLRKEGRI